MRKHIAGAGTRRRSRAWSHLSRIAASKPVTWSRAIRSASVLSPFAIARSRPMCSPMCRSKWVIRSRNRQKILVARLL